MRQPDEGRLPTAALLDGIERTLRARASEAHAGARRDLLIAARLIQTVQRDLDHADEVAHVHRRLLNDLGATDDSDLARKIRDRSVRVDRQELVRRILEVVEQQLRIDSPDYAETGR